MTPRYRLFATLAALSGWFALSLQLGLSIRLDDGRGALAGLWAWLGYFRTCWLLAL